MNVTERPNSESYNNYLSNEQVIQIPMFDNAKANSYNEFGISTDKIGQKGELGRIVKNTLDEFFDKLALMRKALHGELDSYKAMATNDYNSLGARINNLDVILRQDIVNAKNYFYEGFNNTKKSCTENIIDIYGKIHRKKNELEDVSIEIKQALENTKYDFFAKLNKLEKIINEFDCDNKDLVPEIKKLEKNCEDKSEQFQQKLASNYKELQIEIKVVKKGLDDKVGQINEKVAKLKQEIISEGDRKLDVLYLKVISVAEIPLQKLDAKLTKNITEIENKIKPVEKIDENIDKMKNQLEIDIEKKVGKKLQDKINLLIDKVDNLSKYMNNKFDDYNLDALNE